MPASPLDSAVYGKLFGDAEVGALFTDSAEVRAWMLVEGALAKVQGTLGLIPEVAGQAIHRASLELQIDPGGLGTATSENAVPIPGLVAAFRDAMQAPEHAAYLHWGATSQDIMDTGQALRLRQAMAILDARLNSLTRALADLAEAEAETPILARTYGQAAVVTSFGAIVASWGLPLLRHRARLNAVRADVQVVSLAGAAGTLSAMAAKGPEVRAALAEALALSDPGTNWHSTRDGVTALAAWLTGVTGSLGKMGEDLLLLTQSEIAEVALSTGGGSSTMPQKVNPVAPSLLSAIARTAVGLNTTLQSALTHRQQRDGVAWMSEWLTLPQLVVMTARSLAAAEALVDDLSARPEAMARHITATGGSVFAEALSFAMAESMPRPEAQAAVKDMAERARTTDQSLMKIARETFPNLPHALIFDPVRNLGTAPEDARSFAKRARAQE